MIQNEAEKFLASISQDFSRKGCSHSNSQKYFLKQSIPVSKISDPPLFCISLHQFAPKTFMNRPQKTHWHSARQTGAKSNANRCKTETDTNRQLTIIKNKGNSQQNAFVCIFCRWSEILESTGIHNVDHIWLNGKEYHSQMTFFNERCRQQSGVSTKLLFSNKSATECAMVSIHSLPKTNVWDGTTHDSCHYSTSHCEISFGTVELVGEPLGRVTASFSFRSRLPCKPIQNALGKFTAFTIHLLDPSVTCSWYLLIYSVFFKTTFGNSKICKKWSRFSSSHICQ